MSIAKGIRDSIEKSSWIRKMFEEGAKMKAQFGAENVFDFSLGNPDLEPPEEFFSTLQAMLKERKPGSHGYMPNAGFPSVREAIAGKVSREHGVTVRPEGVIMTCGAAGGMNTVLKTILNPGDEVIVLKPYFVEYGFYIGNHGGKMVLVDTAADFSINVGNIKQAITERTRAVIINSPNNPTGKIYRRQEISDLAEMLRATGQTIFLIADEPYREIVYDNAEVPSILAFYNESIVITSYSKSLSLPGERIGYLVLHPSCRDFDMVMAGMILSNRILGYVNAPALMQRVVAELLNVTVDVDIYKNKRDIFIEGLSSAGYDFITPEGAFYLFCKAPTDDDVAFVRHLQKFNILAVPGIGFGGPGYFRLAYCVPESTIRNSMPKFKEAMESYDIQA